MWLLREWCRARKQSTALGADALKELFQEEAKHDEMYTRCCDNTSLIAFCPIGWPGVAKWVEMWSGYESPSRESVEACAARMRAEQLHDGLQWSGTRWIWAPQVTDCYTTLLCEHEAHAVVELGEHARKVPFPSFVQKAFLKFFGKRFRKQFGKRLGKRCVGCQRRPTARGSW